MAGYLLQQDWTEKPPSGTPLRRDGHWNVQNLVGCWAYNEGGGVTAFDIASNKNGTVTAPWDVNGLTFTATGHKVTTGATLADSPNKFTLFSVFKGVNLATAGRIIGNHNGSNYGALLAISSSAPLKVRFLVQTSSAVIPVGATTITNGRVYAAAGVYDGSNARVYLDGKQDAALAQTGNIVNSSNGINIGADANNANILNGAVTLSLIYSRALSPAEAASLSANPWQVFEPRTIWVEVGGGGTDLTFNASSTSISTSLFSPSIVGSATTLVSGATNSTFNLIDPTVSSGASIAVTPAVLAALFGIIDPAVSGSSLATPSAQNAAFAQILANVSGSSLSQVNAVASLLNVLSPLVDLGGNALITPAVLSAVFSTQDPSVYFDNKFAVGVVGSILGSNSPIVIGDASVSPSVIEAIVSAVTPVLRGDSAYSASVVNSVYSAVQPLANLGVTISVNINGATFAINPVTFSDGSIVVNAGAQNVSVNILTPIINKVGRVVMVIQGGSPSVSLFGRSGSLTIQ